MPMPLYMVHVPWCWRCDSEQPELVHDPMMPPDDTIGVCKTCASVRSVVQFRYQQAGKNLKIDFAAEHP
jgi:hypothetical protein